MDDPQAPPPPYEEYAASHSAIARAPIASAEDLIDFDDLHDASIPHDEPPPFVESNSQIGADELPSFEERGSHTSGAPYFALRQTTAPPPDQIQSYRIVIRGNSSPQNLKLPAPAKKFEERGVNKYDWSTFLNHLFPIHTLTESGKIGGYPKEKAPSNGRSPTLKKLPTPPRGSPATLREPASSSDCQGGSQDLKNEVLRRLQIRDVLNEWNDHFFRPRGLQISAKFEDSYPKSKPLPIPENAKNPSGLTPLYEAAKNGDVETVVSLLGRGADPNITPYGGASPLHVAVTAGFESLIKILLDGGAHPDAKPSGGAPPVWHAGSSNLNILSLLLRYGANPDGNSFDGPTALYLAADRSDLPAMRLLLSYGADPSKTTQGGPTALSQAIGRVDMDVLNELLPYMDEDGLNKKFYSYQSPFHVAAANPAFPRSMVRRLLELGANPNYSPTGFPTALGNAAESGDVEIVRLLLEPRWKTDVDKKSWSSPSPLWAAAAKSHYDIVRLLIAHKANLDDTPTGFPTALAAAIDRQDHELVKMLIENGADPNRKPMGGQSALHAVAARGDIATVRMLLEKGADPNDTPPGGPPALFQALERGDKEMFDLLVEHPKIDVNRKPLGGVTTLWQAVSLGDVEKVGILLAMGADPNIFPAGTETALAAAVEREDKEMVKVLLQGGADPSKRRLWGEGAMSAAVRKDNKDILKLFALGKK